MLGSLIGGRYRLDEVVGVGAMGTVYRATDTRTGGTVALKLLHATLAGEEKYRARLLREARLTAAIVSPNVIRVTDLGEHDDLPFLVMEYVPGVALSDVLRARGRLPPAEALAIGRQVALAIEAAYGAGIVHRDLKPDNIKLTAGQVKLLDFGIGAALDFGGSVGGGYTGTPAYSAPEQLDGPGDIRADIYALGVILYELLAGTPPFAGRADADLLLLHATQPPPPLPGDVPAAIAQLVARCLEKSPGDRFQTPAQLLGAIELAVQDPATPGSVQVLEAYQQPPAAQQPPAGGTVDLPARGAVPHNIPRPATTFVGRSRELAEIRRRLATSRLVTVAGIGGSGKTRLAIEAAWGLLPLYPDGAWLVNLAPLAEPELIVQAVAAAAGVQERPGILLLQSVIEHIAMRRLLLVLDNCEHLLDGCAALTEALLAACPSLQILATSREVLGAAEEAVFRIPSLPLPEPSPGEGLDALLQSEAGQLFLSRARAHQPALVLTEGDAGDLERVLRLLHGTPLAIELATAQLRLQTLSELAQSLSRYMQLATGTVSATVGREQGLRLVLDWRYATLVEEDRTLLRRTAVFAGGFGEAAAIAVVGDLAFPAGVASQLDRMANASIFSFESGDEETPARYRALEVLRQYGLERLQLAGEAEAVRCHHRDWYLDLAERAEPELVGPEQRTWLAQLDREQDNLRAALHWALVTGEAEPGLRLGGALWRYWQMRGRVNEGRERLVALLALPAATALSALRARALVGAGNLARLQSDSDSARALYEESLAICTRQDDARGVALALNNLGLLALDAHDFETARRLHEHSLAAARAFGDTRFIAGYLNNLARVTLAQHDLTAARASFEESLVLFRQLGERRAVAGLLLNLGELARRQGDSDYAAECYEESLQLLRESGDRPNLALVLNNLCELHFERGRHGEALAAGEESLELSRALEDRRMTGNALVNLGYLALRQGQVQTAAERYGEALRIRHDLDDETGLVECLAGLAFTGAAFDPDAAAQVVGAALATVARTGAALPLLVWAASADAPRAVLRLLTDPELEAARRAGAAYPRDEVIALALDL